MLALWPHGSLDLRPEGLGVLPGPERVEDVGVRPRQGLGRSLHTRHLVDLERLSIKVPSIQSKWGNI